MKRLLYSVYFLLPCLVFSQTGIGTSNPHDSAVLELKASGKGFLIPRMSDVERDEIERPATGLIIYNTVLNRIEFNSGTPTVPVWTPTSSTSTETTGGPTNPNAWSYSSRIYNNWDDILNSQLAPVKLQGVANAKVFNNYASGGELPEEKGPFRSNSSWIDFFHPVGDEGLMLGVGRPNRGSPNTWQVCLYNSSASQTTFEYISFIPKPASSGSGDGYSNESDITLPSGYFYSALHNGYGLWMSAQQTQLIVGYLFVNGNAYEFKALATHRDASSKSVAYAGIGHRRLGSLSDPNLITVIGKIVPRVIIEKQPQFWNPIIAEVIENMEISPSSLRTLIRAIHKSVPLETLQEIDFQLDVLREIKNGRSLTGYEVVALIEELSDAVPPSVSKQSDYWEYLFTQILTSQSLSEELMRSIILALPLLEHAPNTVYGGFNFARTVPETID